MSKRKLTYALRNQHKIIDAYDDKILKRIIKSLDEHFKIHQFDDELETVKPDGEPFPILVIDDANHTVNIIAFYVIKRTFDNYILAFKEFIG